MGQSDRNSLRAKGSGKRFVGCLETRVSPSLHGCPPSGLWLWWIVINSCVFIVASFFAYSRDAKRLNFGHKKAKSAETKAFSTLDSGLMRPYEASLLSIPILSLSSFL